MRNVDFSEKKMFDRTSRTTVFSLQYAIKSVQVDVLKMDRENVTVLACTVMV